MSIIDSLKKIKEKSGIDTYTIMCLFIIVGVGISSFGLGRLSVENDSFQEDKIITTDISNQLGSAEKISSNISDNSLQNKRYVASKNGKLYYTVGCSGAKRISPKNEIWFETAEEAEKSGYELSTSCNQ
jgi:hypothetical protein